jgi:hypothetical protein
VTRTLIAAWLTVAAAAGFAAWAGVQYASASPSPALSQGQARVGGAWKIEGIDTFTG